MKTNLQWRHANRAFSVANLLLAHDPSERGVDIGYELEVSQELSHHVGRKPEGVFVPLSALSTRDLTVGTPTAGGHTVATDLLAGSAIDVLAPFSRIIDRATHLNDLQGNVAIPRQTGAATAYWLGESGAPTESQQAFDQVPLAPKTLGAFTDMSRRLLKQSSLDIEAFVRRDLAATLALEINRAAVSGAGASNEPTGVLNTSGIGSVTAGDAIPTWDDVVDLETLVANQNADTSHALYLLTPGLKGALAKTEQVANSGVFIWDRRAKRPLNDYEAVISTQLPTNGGAGSGHTLLFGNFADLLIGHWGVVDIVVDPYTFSTSGALRVTVFQDVDVAVRHPESFAAITDAGIA